MQESQLRAIPIVSSCLRTPQRILFDLGGIIGNAGEGVEECVPLVAVAVPSADLVDAGEGSDGHAGAEGGVVGELLEAVGEGSNVARLDDKACLVICKKMFGSGGAAGDDRASAGHR